jgi:hypothetical protein
MGNANNLKNFSRYVQFVSNEVLYLIQGSPNGSRYL